VGKEFWQPLLGWIKDTVYGKYGAIDREDMDLYHLVDNADEAWELVKVLMKKHKLQRGDIH
jgi:predicted Rossmann-fold nucleotide-binding protein